LKALNLSTGNPKQYLACPNCLTDVTLQERTSVPEDNLGLESDDIKTPKENIERENLKPQPSKTTCTHHFGYLSERSTKEKMPEECMNCPEVVNCMLKAVKRNTNN